MVLRSTVDASHYSLTLLYMCYILRLNLCQDYNYSCGVSEIYIYTRPLLGSRIHVLLHMALMILGSTSAGTAADCASYQYI